MQRAMLGTWAILSAGLAPGVTATAAAPRSPAMIYAKVCGYCHGQRVGPIIRGRALALDYIVQMVRSGPGAMPAFRPTEISDRELQALSHWIHDSKADPQEHAR